MKILAFIAFVWMAGCSGGESPAEIARQKANNMAAMAELRKTPWVRDLLVSPDHMNIGVVRGGRKWDSPEMKESVCGVLKRHGCELTWVRFVDSGRITDKKSLQETEIAKVRCREP